MKHVLPDLPPIDAVHVIDLTFGIPNEAGMTLQDLRERTADARQARRDLAANPLAGVRIEGERAQEIASLWRQLPFAPQDRCHFPPFGLRFWSGDRIILYASMCWDCNNVWIMEGEKHTAAEFDGEAEVSLRLFYVLTNIANINAS